MHHPIFASLEAANPSFINFFTELSHQLVQFAQQAIDTPTERKAVEDAVLAYVDKYFLSYFPDPMRKPFHEAILSMIDSTLVTIASV